MTLRVSHRFLRILAALTYYGGAVGLSANALGYLGRGADAYPGWEWIAGAAGVTLGLLRGRTMFTRACRKNLRRIYSLADPRPWQFFRPAFFAALLLMIAAGVTLSGVAEASPRASLVVGALELTIGVGLLTASRLFWTWSPETEPDPESVRSGIASAET